MSTPTATFIPTSSESPQDPFLFVDAYEREVAGLVTAFVSFFVSAAMALVFKSIDQHSWFAAWLGFVIVMSYVVVPPCLPMSMSSKIRVLLMLFAPVLYVLSLFLMAGALLTLAVGLSELAVFFVLCMVFADEIVP